ncbi:MAG: ABC transporter substrate-binding protein [Streptosporangiaceae bacterium]|nr:ABC transporter substrate-binding protein [Streptosporangiaceae bacterium]MBV9856650.1 ABC transporter substrate-binding protein [Streptosporangiaceae bacterium]
MGSGQAGRDGGPARWRAGAVAIAAVVMSLSAAACGSSTSSTPGAGGSATASGSATSGNITWWASPITTSTPDPRAVLISAFEKAYPHIHVTLQSAPTDTDTNRASLITTISGGAASPDVYMGDVIWPAQFGHAGLAVPLSKYLPGSYWSTFAPGLVAGATYSGQVWGAPFFEDQGFLYYRKDLLAKEHMPVPTTWQQLETDAVALKNKGLVKYGYVWQGASYEGLTCNFMEYLGSAGGSVLNSSLTKATIDSPAGTQALTFMRSLITSGASPGAVTTFQEAQAMSAFATGQAAFLRNWNYGWIYSQTASSPSSVVGKVGVAPLPAFAGQPSPGTSNIGGWNLYINPHSKNIAADLTFIKWMTGPAAQTTLATEFAEIPTVQSVRASQTVVAKDPVLAAVPKTRLIPRPAQSPAYAKVSQAIYTNVNSVLSGSASPGAALSSAASQINAAETSTGL